MDIRLPCGIEPFRLARKRESYREYGGGRPMRFVHAIEPAGEAETVCIQVAAADSLYVTDDFLLTHNTLNDSFVILDEAQNTSPEQMKMFLTRLGFNSRMVVTGDITQIDLPSDQRSGLIAVRDILDRGPGHLLRRVRRRGRGPPQAGPAHRRRLRRARRRREGGTQRTRPDPALLSADLTDVPAELRDGGRGDARRRRRRRRPPRGRAGRRRADPELNREHRGKDAPTDVLAFPVDGTGPIAGPRELGDVAICPEHCADVTEAAVHGVLHLCGHDHETDDGEMLAEQERILAGLR